jgi:hypothetical protein
LAAKLNMEVHTNLSGEAVTQFGSTTLGYYTTCASTAGGVHAEMSQPDLATSNLYFSKTRVPMTVGTMG